MAALENHQSCHDFKKIHMTRSLSFSGWISKKNNLVNTFQTMEIPYDGALLFFRILKLVGPVGLEPTTTPL